MSQLDARTRRHWGPRVPGSGPAGRAEPALAAVTRLDGPAAGSHLLTTLAADPATRVRRPAATPPSEAPVVTESHPHLAPPEVPYEPVTPIAAASLRRGARAERRDTEPSDTIDLTARIKRILDDEARRHGIEV
jgi:hypothetical protein